MIAMPTVQYNKDVSLKGKGQAKLFPTIKDSYSPSVGVRSYNVCTDDIWPPQCCFIGIRTQEPENDILATAVIMSNKLSLSSATIHETVAG